jgi:iron complex outermembrane receptor protein
MGYGVAGGAAGGMSIRGIGGMPTSGVLILMDSYQSMITERVEVVRGPASVLYGSNAMGGVINIITKKQRKDGWHNSAQLMYGSYNTFSAEASSGWKKDKLRVNGSLGYNRSDGHRDNMDFEQLNVLGKIGYDFSSNWHSFVDLNLSNTRSSNPGSVASPIIDNDADITRGVTSFSLENEYERTSGALKFFCNFGAHEIDDGYSTGQQPKTYHFQSNDQMLGLTLYQSYAFFKGNKTTAGVDFHRFGGKAWNHFLDGSDDTELADIHLNNVAGYVNVQQSLLQNRLTLNAGLRLDHHEINGSEWIPQAGLSFVPSATTTVKAVVSKGFRNPNIREMYMFPPRNPDLLPERLMNYELSFMQSLFQNRLNLGLNLFYIKGDNMIQVTMVEGRPLNTNTGEVENKGFEITADYRVTPSLQLSANYSLLDMTYKIVGAPEHKLYASVNYTKNRWGFSTGLQYIGDLYTAVKPELVKDSFFLWNARANYQVLDWLNLFLKGENLLGQEYEINAGYPMPKTTVFGGIRLDF